MGSTHDLKDKLHHGDGSADPLGLDDALRKLGEGRDRLGEAAADAVEALRDDADVALDQVRRRGRRMRRDARGKARAAGRRWGLPAIAAATAAVAGATALLVGLVKGRTSIKSAADASTDKMRTAARRVSQSQPVKSVMKK